MKPETALTETETVDCEPEDVPELPSNVAPPGGLAITLAERSAARRALKRTGYTTIKLDRVEAQSAFGRYVAKLGVFTLATMEYVVTKEQLAEAIETTVTLDAELTNPEARAELMITREKLLKQRGDLVGIAFKAGAVEMQSQTQNNPNNIPFPANAQITAISLHLPQPAEVKS